MKIDEDGKQVTNVYPYKKVTGASCYGALNIGRNKMSKLFVYH